MDPFFQRYRNGIIGNDILIPTPGGAKRMLYADWTASGRCYAPIENRIREVVLPLIANTHSETSTCGAAMTYAYHSAREVIRKHVNAGDDDVLISIGSGMTHAVNKLQRILGLKSLRGKNRPVIFVTHMEHHSNHISWLETQAVVEIIRPGPDGNVDLDHLAELLDQHRDRPMKIASITACSNVTGIVTPYRSVARIMHRHGGYCFVDFACSAPYVHIDMHPPQDEERLDAIFFSPHKFLGGPGSSGVLVFTEELYHSRIPDQPGGGCVYWTDPRGGTLYIDDPNVREDGGTPGLLQTIKAAMCLRLKEEMGVPQILDREHHLLTLLWEKIKDVPGITILESHQMNRLGILSFQIDGLHYHVASRLLNDRFGIQCRAGCSCAGTYGHFLLNIDQLSSEAIRQQVAAGDFTLKPGWVRISLHPTMSDEEVEFIGDSVAELAMTFPDWIKEYHFDPVTYTLQTPDGLPDASLCKKLNRQLWQTEWKSHEGNPTVHSSIAKPCQL